MSSETVAHQVAQKTREMGKTEEPTKNQNHEKLSVFRGSAVMFGHICDTSYPVGTRTTGVSSANSALSEIPGAQAGAIEAASPGRSATGVEGTSATGNPVRRCGRIQSGWKGRSVR